MYGKLRIAFGITLALLLVSFPAATSFAAELGLETDCTVLVGYAENGGPHGDVTLIVPGTLIPTLEGDSWPSDMSTLQEQLKNAYRLKKMRETTGISKLLEVDKPEKLPTSEGIAATLTLVGFNDKVATYQAEMTLNNQSLASASLSVSLGGRAVMGSRLDNAAHDDPYIFLVVEAALQKKGSKVQRAGYDGFTKPKPIETVNPIYPEEARKAQISGSVFVEVLVDTDGSCQVVEVTKSPDEILSAAAIEAVKQWKFDPGLNPEGKPVKLSLTLTIKFALK